MASEPLITFLVTPRLSIDFLAEALASVRAQTAPVELVVALDPRPAPESRAMAEAVRPDGRWVAAARAGLGPRLDAGLSRATGRYVAFLAAEDVALPDRAESQIAILESRGCDALFSPPMLIESAGRPLLDEAAPSRFGARPDDLDARPLRVLVEHPQYLCLSTACVRRSLLTHVGSFSAEAAPELDYWLRANRAGKRFIMSSEPVTKLRLPGKFARHLWEHAEETAIVEAIRLADLAQLRREFADLLPTALPLDAPRELVEAVILLHHAASRVRDAGLATVEAFLAAADRSAELALRFGLNEYALRRARGSVA